MGLKHQILPNNHSWHTFFFNFGVGDQAPFPARILVRRAPLTLKALQDKNPRDFPLKSYC